MDRKLVPPTPTSLDGLSWRERNALKMRARGGRFVPVTTNRLLERVLALIPSAPESSATNSTSSNTSITPTHAYEIIDNVQASFERLPPTKSTRFRKRKHSKPMTAYSEFNDSLADPPVVKKRKTIQRGSTVVIGLKEKLPSKRRAAYHDTLRVEKPAADIKQPDGTREAVRAPTKRAHPDTALDARNSGDTGENAALQIYVSHQAESSEEDALAIRPAARKISNTSSNREGSKKRTDDSDQLHKTVLPSTKVSSHRTGRPKSDRGKPGETPLVRMAVSKHAKVAVHASAKSTTELSAAVKCSRRIPGLNSKRKKPDILASDSSDDNALIIPMPKRLQLHHIVPEISMVAQRKVRRPLSPVGNSQSEDESANDAYLQKHAHKTRRAAQNESQHIDTIVPRNQATRNASRVALVVTPNAKRVTDKAVTSPTMTKKSPKRSKRPSFGDIEEEVDDEVNALNRRVEEVISSVPALPSGSSDIERDVQSPPRAVSRKFTTGKSANMKVNKMRHTELSRASYQSAITATTTLIDSENELLVNSPTRTMSIANSSHVFSQLISNTSRRGFSKPRFKSLPKRRPCLDADSEPDPLNCLA